MEIGTSLSLGQVLMVCSRSWPACWGAPCFLTCHRWRSWRLTHVRFWCAPGLSSACLESLCGSLVIRAECRYIDPAWGPRFFLLCQPATFGIPCCSFVSCCWHLSNFWAAIAYRPHCISPHSFRWSFWEWVGDSYPATHVRAFVSKDPAFWRRGTWGSLLGRLALFGLGRCFP